MNLKMLVSIVPHEKGEKLTRAAMESGCRGGTVLIGRSLAESNFAAVLGLGESTKDIILMIVTESAKDSVRHAILQATSKEKRKFGEIFCCDLNFFLRSGTSNGKQPKAENFEENDVVSNNEDNNMAKNKSEMITVIVNKGFADDVMAAARSAGAGGGTVVNARGTARENDERFFGMHIVPEKEMLIMIVPSEKKDDVMKAISEVKCLKEPGMGIAYSSSVEDFSLLGKR